MKLSILPAAIALFLTIVMVAGSSHAATPQPDAGAGQGVVMLETEGSAGISVRMAEELARILNDGSRRRILPVIGTGSLQNIVDLRLMRGIDLAIAQKDVLDYAKQRNLVPQIESWLRYITTFTTKSFNATCSRTTAGALTAVARGTCIAADFHFSLSERITVNGRSLARL